MGAVVALVVGAFLIYTTMTMAITQRRPVISMLRAIGGRRATIVRDMLAEAAILGVIGGAIGSGLGILMGRSAIGRLPPAMTQGLEARVEYWLPEYAIPAAVLATALTSVVASAMAARQVYKVAPIEALAPVGVSAADRVPRWLRIASGVGAVAGFWSLSTSAASWPLSRCLRCSVPRSHLASRSLCPSSTSQPQRPESSGPSGPSRRRRSSVRHDECGQR
jgi:putative ABC transport system permease protein